MNARKFFTAEERQRIVDSILQAESHTSGEIRVHIEGSCKGEVLSRAAVVFGQLKMDRTAQRNGVLFYLAVNDRKFAVLGDKGIHELVPEDFWDEVKNAMLVHFQRGAFTDGICKGIDMAGEKLGKYFPLQRNDRNELNNEVSFGE
jgi:uncharacterized membrane protein